MKLADLFIKLGLRKDGFDKGLDDAKKKTNVFGNAVKKIGGLLAGAFAVDRLIAFGRELVQIGGVAQGVEDAFVRIGDAQTLRGLQQATRGTVSELELMKRAVSANNLGIPIQNLASLFEFATKRAQDTGESVDYLVNSIVTGIGRKSPLILDNLGISAIQLREKLNGVGLETASVADVAAAVGDIAAESMRQSGEIIDTNAIKMQNLGAQWDNFKKKLATNKAVIDSVGDSLTKTQELLFVWASDTATAWQKLTMSINGFDKSAHKQYLNIKKQEDELTALRQKSSTELTAMLDSEINKRDEIAGKIDEYSRSFRELVGEKGYAGAKKFLKGLRSDWQDQSNVVNKLREDIEKVLELRGLEGTQGPKPFDMSGGDFDFPQWEKQLGYTDALRELLKDTKIELDTLMKTGGKFHGEKSAEDFIKKVDELSGKINDLTEKLKFKDVPRVDMEELTPRGTSTDELEKFFPDWISPDSSMLDNMDAFKAKINERLAKLVDAETLAKMTENFNETEAVAMELTSALESGLVSAFQGVGEAIGEAIAGGSWDDFGKAILKIIGSFMQILGGAIIAIGVALLELELNLTAANAPGVIAAGIGLTIAGAALSSIVSGGIKGKGGGAYAGATSSTGGSSASTALSGDVRFVLEGDKLVGAINGSRQRRSITG